jgi:membrane-associated phospholipid phosphatase
MQIDNLVENTSDMKKFPTLTAAVLVISVQLFAQLEPEAGKWKTWFINSGKDYRLTAPPSYKQEIYEIIKIQKALDSTSIQAIAFWNAGAPGYRWQEMVNKLWMYDTTYNGALAYMLLSVATYDATVAAWDTKYAYNRPRPYSVDRRIKDFGIRLESPSYPCEYAVAAGAAATVIAHFYPLLADSVLHMAQQLINARIASGSAFPSDTRAGFELGKKIAEKEIERTKDYTTKNIWDGKVPNKAGMWTGKFAMLPLAGQNKTVVLDSASQFRPAPPPDFAKDMEELKKFKQTFRSKSNAFFWASQPYWGEILNRKIFESNLHLNAPKAARIYAITAIATYDAFIACWDAKYAYWGIRPDQYDTTYHSLVPTPPFPGYPSGHAAISGTMAELYSYFFPGDAAYFQQKAKEAAESRFQAGIHFRTDNEIGLQLGRKVAKAVIQKVKADGAPDDMTSLLKK